MSEQVLEHRAEKAETSPPLETRSETLQPSPQMLVSRLEALADRLRSAEAGIGAIRLEQEAKKPWWKQTAIIISVVGLVLSSGFSVYTAHDQATQRKLDDKKQKAAALDSSLADIVALRMEDARQSSALASTNPAAYRAWVAIAEAKRSMLIDASVAAVRNLNYDISATAALVLGGELVQDSRLGDAEKVLEAGLKAAAAAGSAKGAVQSVLAQVYMLPGSAKYDPARGRRTYHEAIDSFSGLSDYSALSRKLEVIEWWASAEANLGNLKESAELIREARRTLATSPLSPVLKAPLIQLMERAAIQIQQTTAGSTNDPSRILGTWRVSDSDRKAGSLIISLAQGSSVPMFAKDKLEGGVLSGRITGSVYAADASHLRLDWNFALAVNPGSSPQMAGYSDVRLRPDGTMEGVDYAFNLPAKTWTARKSTPAQ